MYFLKLTENYDVRYLYIRIFSTFAVYRQTGGPEYKSTSLDFKNIYNKTSNLHPYH